jgi:hypothetical protein
MKYYLHIIQVVLEIKMEKIWNNTNRWVHWIHKSALSLLEEAVNYFKNWSEFLRSVWFISFIMKVHSDFWDFNSFEKLNVERHHFARKFWFHCPSVNQPRFLDLQNSKSILQGLRFLFFVNMIREITENLLPFSAISKLLLNYINNFIHYKLINHVYFILENLPQNYYLFLNLIIFKLI